MSIEKFRNYRNENAFTLIDVMLGTSTVGLIMAGGIAFATAGPADEFERTFGQFEQWSVSQPVSSTKIMDNQLSYREVSYLITGEYDDSIDAMVNYVPFQDGNYKFCIHTNDKSKTFYKYSSETEDVIEDENCMTHSIERY